MGLQQWAKWRSPRQARHYARQPPTWTLPDTLCPPHPARYTSSPARDLDCSIITTKDLWPREARAPITTRAPRKAPPPAHVVGNPHFNDHDSSSSGEESVDCDAQRHSDCDI